MFFLILSFFSVAFIYSMVGFGGGSSYLALLALFHVSYEMIPKISLLCNIIVVFGGVIHFVRNKHLSWSLTWPLIVSSIPMAYIGGCISISAKIFYFLLGAMLIASGIKPILERNMETKKSKPIASGPTLYLLLGGLIGLVSGMVGIGGGVFLAPILLNITQETPKTVAASSAVFILCNSISGLMGQVVKSDVSVETLFQYWPLFAICMVAGQAGSFIGSGKMISQKRVGFITSLLVLYVGAKIILRVF